MKLVTTFLRTFTLDGDGNRVLPAKSQFTKAKNKEMSDQLLFRHKLSLQNQCKDLTKNEIDNYPEMEIEISVNDKPNYKGIFRNGEITFEESFNLTVK